MVEFVPVTPKASITGTVATTTAVTQYLQSRLVEVYAEFPDALSKARTTCERVVEIDLGL
jgi:hypothetical protein